MCGRAKILIKKKKIFKHLFLFGFFTINALIYKERCINYMSKKFNYIYITTNLITNKSYIGSHCTDNIDDGYIGSGRLFLKSVRKHGKENFSRRILEICDDASIARGKEEYFIEAFGTLYPSGYNLSTKGGIGFKGSMHTLETKKKMSIWQRGKTYEELYGFEKAAEMKRKQSEKKKGKSTSRKGRGHKQELIEKYGIEEGNKRYNEFIKKQRESHKGKIPGIKGKYHSKETREKISKKISKENHPNWGIKLSEEIKKKLRKPKNTKQKELLKNPKIINKIKEMRNLGFSYKKITMKTGINYFLLKNII
jgi:group I intron endonuclease